VDHGHLNRFPTLVGFAGREDDVDRLSCFGCGHHRLVPLAECIHELLDMLHVGDTPLGPLPDIERDWFVSGPECVDFLAAKPERTIFVGQVERNGMVCVGRGGGTNVTKSARLEPKIDDTVSSTAMLRASVPRSAKTRSISPPNHPSMSIDVYLDYFIDMNLSISRMPRHLALS
jgi:hypothetical protein